MRNIKFRTLVHGRYGEPSDVVIRMRPGQSLGHDHFESHDEGWSAETVVWTCFEDGTLRGAIWCDGCDCDGRLSSSHESLWDGVTLNDYGYPDWQPISSSQRDYTAESMNY